MGEIIKVDKNSVELWLENPRFGDSKDQEEAIDKIKDTKGFRDLVASIKEYGFQENNLPTVKKHLNKEGFYTVVDGNRRITALKEIGKIQEINVYRENDPEKINAILDREHGKSPAGTLRWNSVQRARHYHERYKQGLYEKIPNDDVRALMVLEEALSENLEENFPLTTFLRLMNEKFDEDFGVFINEDGSVEVEKPGFIVKIHKDIKDGEIDSRKLNTEDNIKEYLSRLLEGQSQEERTDLKDDNDDDFDDSEDAGNRLLNRDQIDQFKNVLKNNEGFARELSNAPLNRYPNLLRLATRAIIDTLYNIEKGEDREPKACPSGHFKEFADLNRKEQFSRVPNLIDELARHAHHVDTRVVMRNTINDDRELLDEILSGFIREIKKQK